MLQDMTLSLASGDNSENDAAHDALDHSELRFKK